jgi:hypothetical protein
VAILVQVLPHFLSMATVWSEHPESICADQEIDASVSPPPAP